MSDCKVVNTYRWLSEKTRAINNLCNNKMLNIYRLHLLIRCKYNGNYSVKQLWNEYEESLHFYKCNNKEIIKKVISKEIDYNEYLNFFPKS